MKKGITQIQQQNSQPLAMNQEGSEETQEAQTELWERAQFALRPYCKRWQARYQQPWKDST